MIASVLHRAAGLTIAADRPLPGFVVQPDPSARVPDVQFQLEALPPWHGDPAALLHRAPDSTASGEPIVTVSRSARGFHFAYADGTRAWIDVAGANVWCTWPPSATLDDTCTYLYGPILGLVLRLRGLLTFHASAVQFRRGAIGFAGPHGSGKSTLAAALSTRGCPVVTDDVLQVRLERTQWLAEPFASMLKLWPEGAQLALHRSDLPRIAEGWDKRALALGDATPGVTDTLPLTALACFTDPAEKPAIAAMRPATALLRLTANTSAAHLLDPDARAAEFRALSALVRDVPCVAITPPADPRDHPRFVDEIFNWGMAC